MKPKSALPDPVIKTADPFEFWPDAQSRIAGLGGTVPPLDPPYAFHTGYQELGNGVVTCTLRFGRLEATIGVLTVRVSGIAPDPGAASELIRTWTADLRDIAESDGVLELSFQASAGSRYAMLGQIFQDSDASARSLTVEYLLSPDEVATSGQAVRKTLFGRRMFRRTAKMQVRAQPTLADPVSQACTPSQLTEPTYARWLGALPGADMIGQERWGLVFVLQALERYGAMRPGARGLGLEVAASALPAVMAARGCTVHSLRHQPDVLPGEEAPTMLADALEELRYPNVCADDVFDRQVSVGGADLGAIDTAPTGYDFAWSVHAMELLGSIDAGAAFVRQSIGRLAYGGLAVHITLVNTGSLTETVDTAALVLQRRQDLDRIAIDLVSRGHYIAQLNFDFGDPPIAPLSGAGLSPDDPDLAAALDRYAPIPFGLIVRRGDR